MSFAQGAPTQPLVLQGSNVFLYGSSTAGNAFTVQQLGAGNVASFQTTSGSAALVINPSGNVGIGKTNPGYALDVTGDLNFTGTFRQNGTAYIGSQWTGTSTLFFVGNVGINTTSVANPLTVGGTVVATTFSGSGASLTSLPLNQFSGLTAGGIAYGSATTTIATNTVGLAGQPLLSGAAGAPTWGTLGITYGGTGQTTASAAFNALSPMTTAGDLIYGGTSGAGTRLATGTATQLLHGGTTPTWSAISLTADVSGTLPVANGGTGQTTAQAAMNALAGAQTNAQYLRGNGTNVVMSAIQAADVPTLNQNTTGSAGSLSTNFTSGYVLYGQGTGVPAYASGHYWDNTNGRLGIGMTNPGYPLDVTGDMHCSGAIYCGNNSGSTAAGSIGGRMYFGGTYGDQNYTDGGQILSRLYATSESSELVIFKGNDITGGPGPDRIRLRAAAICFDTYPSTSSDPAAENIRVTINESGNVGIGKTNPTTALDVVGTVTATTFSGSAASLTSFPTLNQNTTGSAASATTATNQSGGTVSATTGTFSSTVALTEANANLGLNRGAIWFNGNGDLNHYLYNNYNNRDGAGAFDGMKWNVYAGLWIRGGQYGANTGLFMNSSGNVGIGTTSPAFKHHVYNGDASFTYYGPNATWGGYLLVGAGVNNITSGRAQVISSNGNLHLDSGTGQHIHLNYHNQSSGIYSYGPWGHSGNFTMSTNATRIQFNNNTTWSGDVGAGCGKLEYHIQRWYISSGTDSDRIVQFRRSATDTSYIANDGTFVGPISTGSLYSTANPRIQNSSPTIIFQDTDHKSAYWHCNANLMYLLSGPINAGDGGWQPVNNEWPAYWELNNNNVRMGGAITAVGDITAFVSDERLKTKVGLIENALEKVCSLTAFKYTHNDIARQHGFTDDIVYVGLSAQEVQKVLPEVVKPAPFDYDFEKGGTTKKSKSGENYLTVQYDRVVSLLVEAVKEERQKREELEARLVRLEKLLLKE